MHTIYQPNDDITYKQGILNDKLDLQLYIVKVNLRGNEETNQQDTTYECCRKAFVVFMANYYYHGMTISIDLL